MPKVTTTVWRTVAVALQWSCKRLGKQAGVFESVARIARESACCGRFCPKTSLDIFERTYIFPTTCRGVHYLASTYRSAKATERLCPRALQIRAMPCPQ
jgi:hypothetical protein